MSSINSQCYDSKGPNSELCSEQIFARSAALLFGALSEKFAMSGDKITVAIDDLSAIVDSSTKTRSLTNVEHGVSQAIDMLLKVVKIKA